MFCENTDDVLLYLQSVINDILKSKREAYSYWQCKMTIREAFIFSCLHMDKRKITILWQIIKAHDISIFQAEDLFDFSEKIVDFVRILLHNTYTVFDMPLPEHPASQTDRDHIYLSVTEQDRYL
jgi:hypothetical protein